MTDWDEFEQSRVKLQTALDSAKPIDTRNRMGQFATPTALAREIVDHALGIRARSLPIHFLDPAFGTGSFYSALCARAKESDLLSARGFEIDPHYEEPARKLWDGDKLEITRTDFTRAEPGKGDLANLVICNPPYVRHHHLDSTSKKDIQARVQAACSVKMDGLSGLYCYFLGLSHKWMNPGAIAGWLVPSEFMMVNYGRQVREYLLEKVTLLQIHRFDPENVQFADALVSSAVVWFKNEGPPPSHSVNFSYGGTLSTPESSRRIPLKELCADSKWTRYFQKSAEPARPLFRLGDLFDIKRGVATGSNSFFILDRRRIDELELPMECFTPVLPSSRYMPENEVHADENGWPRLDRQVFLLDLQLPESEIAKRFPAMMRYLESGRTGDRPVAARYLCRSRRPWYLQESRPPAPIICTYMGRSRNGRKPFRFILNYSRATACNGFLMLYPKGEFASRARNDPRFLKTVWMYLNEIDPSRLSNQGRVYGGGLYKLEPSELRDLPADDLLARISE